MYDLACFTWFVAIVVALIALVEIYFINKRYKEQIDFLKRTEDITIKAYNEATELIIEATKAVRAIEIAHKECDQMRLIDTDKICKHGYDIAHNEIGEEIVFCEIFGAWRNVTLGECMGNCESEESEE